jgi:hypothetical protein
MAKLPKKRRFTMNETKEAVIKINEPEVKATPKPERPGVNSKGRVKVTTMLDPDLRDELKMMAIRRGVNFADILDKALRDYLEDKL